MKDQHDGQLALGCNRLGSATSGSTPRTSRQLVHAALELGIASFDTADSYSNGGSERALGAALRGRSEAVQIATKGGYTFRERSAAEQLVRRVLLPLVTKLRARDKVVAPGAGSGDQYTNQNFSEAALIAAASASRQRLGVASLDIYQLHGPTVAEIESFATIAAALRQAHTINAIGVGLNSAADAHQWIRNAPVDVVQAPFGLLDPQLRESGAIAAADERNVHLLVRGVFGAGLLSPRLSQAELESRTAKVAWVNDLHALAANTGVPTLQLAAWFVRRHTPHATWVIGASSPTQLAQSCEFFRTPLPSDDLFDAIDTITAHHGPLTGGRP
jgi:D-threo-aldose 1-dehydrogenase